MNGYDLSKSWFRFRYGNKDVKAIHTELYFYIVDLWNRVGQPQQFGLPTDMTLNALGLGSYNTYKSALIKLYDWGFVVEVTASQNQYQSRIIALSNIDKSLDKSLDKALIGSLDKASDNTNDESVDSIIKQETSNNKPFKQETIKGRFTPPSNFNYKKELSLLVQNTKLVDDYILLRKTKKAPLTETALEILKKECDENNFSIEEALRVCIEKNWQGFKVKWLNDDKNGKSNQEQRAVSGFKNNRPEPVLQTNR